MYECALGRSGLPADEALSMGVHESQSLFWERHVGLSRPFWKYAGKHVRASLGIEAEDEQIYAATNRVRPSLIRVEADELTYRTLLPRCCA
jgi:carboxypeptidase Taq